MSYTPIGWQTGDTITADKLNKMNPGWGVSSTQFFSETVTTTDTGHGFAAGSLVYVFQSEPPETAVITFDGASYACNLNSNNGYGDAGASGPEFTNYPFYIWPKSGTTEIYTSTAGEHTVQFATQGIEVSDNFSAAVGMAMPEPEPDVFWISAFDGSTDKTYNEIYDAFMAGTRCFLENKGAVLTMWSDSERYYMAVATYNNGKFDPVIYRTAGDDPDWDLSFWKYNSQV